MNDAERDAGARLMLAWRDGDEGAFERLVTAYSGQVFGLLTRFLGRHPAREDLVQEVFLRLSRRGQVKEIEDLEAYLFQTAASVVVDSHRKSATRHATFHVEYDETAHAPSEFSSERILAGKQDLDRVLTGLRELPERTRHVFMLSRFEHFRHAAIARKLGISVSAVEKHLVRALAHLTECLERSPK